MHATITPQFALPPACPGLLSPHLLLHWGCPLVLCNPPPAPSSGSRGVISHPLPTAADRPQGCALAPGKGFSPHWATGQPPQMPCMHLRVLTPLPWGGHPADSQAPPRHLSHRLASPWLRVASLSHYPLQPPPSCQRTHPHRLALGWQEGPSCHPHPPSSTTSSSCDCRGGSGVKQTKRQNQTRYMQYLSVCTCKV